MLTYIKLPHTVAYMSFFILHISISIHTEWGNIEDHMYLLSQEFSCISISTEYLSAEDTFQLS